MGASSLQGRLPALTKRMKKLCVELHKTNPAPELAEDLDHFTGKDLTHPCRDNKAKEQRKTS